MQIFNWFWRPFNAENVAFLVRIILIIKFGEI